MKGETLHQLINGLMGIVFGTGGQVCVFAGGNNAGMTEKILHILQANARFDQMSRKASASCSRPLPTSL